MKKHIVSLPHHPKRVIIISLFIALTIGAFGYYLINKESGLAIKGDSDININKSSLARNITLGFLVGGKIETVSAKAGDMVKKGQVLATLNSGNTLGVLDQAKAAYKTAEANYQKIINGATGPAIDISKSAVNAAKVNLYGVTNQQNLLVENAKTNFMNSTLAAKPEDNNLLAPPSISGIYNKNVEGKIIINIYNTSSDGVCHTDENSGCYFTVSGVASGRGDMSTTKQEPISDTGLFIEFPSQISSYVNTTWSINVPNDTAPNYLANSNTYKAALETRDQLISNAQASLDQANASLASLVASARPEDIVVAQAQIDNAAGAVRIAEAAFQNTIITAPSDGTVVSVAIAPGQIALPNTPAIEFISLASSNN